MQNINLAAVVLNQTPLDWSGNKKRIIDALNDSRSHNIQLFCFPELCISGYGCEDAFYSPFVSERSIESLFQILPFTKNKIVTLGFPFFFRGSIFNVNAIIVDEKIVGIVPKKFLAGDGVHYEHRWFRPWDNQALEIVEIENPFDKIKHVIPLGDYFFEIGGVKIGLEICEEAWVAQRVGAGLSKKGVDIILNPSASHFAFGKQEVRKRFVVEGSRAFGVAYVYTNLLGNESGRIIFDGGALVASNGKMVLESPRFSFNEYEIYSSQVDISENRIRRLQTANFKPELGMIDHSQISVLFNWASVKMIKRTSVLPGWEKSELIKNEEFYRAMTLSLFDYMRKSKSNGFVISLSGGVDSAVVSLLATKSLVEAYKALGESEFKNRLSYIKKISQLNDIHLITKELIHVAYQSSENSSNETKQAATELAKELSIKFYDWSIAAMVDSYKNVIESSIGRKLTWENDDITLQNIQARTRSPGIWMLANLNNALLLATSNRSEAAVGYATMDGDTSGGLSPIGGVDKVFLRQWLKWFYDKGPLEVGSLKSLKFVFVKPPTAELRPIKFSQTDEVDLMPYEILDRIERAFIRDRQTPVDIVEILASEFSELEISILAGYVIKFLRLWSRNQWKRERYAPSFHIDDESLDPKTWCRYPILMNSFESEIEQIQKKYQPV